MTVRPIAPETRVPKRSSTLLAPFRIRDFRFLWFGLLVSNFGTWMQITALGYLVVKIAGDAAHASLDVGILGAASAIPVVLLSPLAGVVADRFPRRRVLLITNLFQAATAFVLAILTSTGAITLIEIFAIAALRSGTQAFDAPARQSWVPLLVPRELVGNAIGLNSVAFNGPSVIGPPIAGLLILTVGIAASFYANAAFTIAVVAALVAMRPAPVASHGRESVVVAMLAGFRFLWSHRVLRSVIAMLIVVCLFARPYLQLLPAYAAHVVHVDARGLGLLLGATGLGAMAGSLVTAAVSEPRRKIVWYASAMAIAVGAIVLGLARDIWVATSALVFIGCAVLAFTGTTNVLLQTLSPDAMRGRVIAVFSMVVLGLVPAGALVLGTLATIVGLAWSLVAGGLVTIVAATMIWSRNAELRIA